MADLAEMQTNRAALVAALSGGEMKVVFHSGGTRREVEYRSIPDLERAVAFIDREIASLSNKRVHTWLVNFKEPS